MTENKAVLLRKWLRKDHLAFRVFVSELFGTLFMAVFVTCAACQVILSRGRSGNMVSGFFGTVFGVTFAIYVSFKASGAHINPIVTTVMVLFGQTQRRLLIVYWVAQYIGAFLGAAMAYGVYSDSFKTFDGGNRTIFGENGTGAIFSSFPQSEDISIVTCVFDQLLSSAVLIIGILTIIDPSNMQLPPHLLPPVAGVLVGMLIATLGHNCFAPLNPAKDFSSRVFMAIAGWGAEPFSHRDYTWFYIPLIVPHVGAVLGMIAYKAFVKAALASKEEDEREEEEKLPSRSDAALTNLLKTEKAASRFEQL